MGGKSVAATAGASLIAAAGALVTGVLAAPEASAGPAHCNDAFCTPGITPNVVLGAPCDRTDYFVFGTAVAGPSIQPGRLVFCGSPRRYEPRWFRSPPMVGIRDLNSPCTVETNSVAQAPDGLFLTCVSMNGQSLWLRGDT